MARTRDNTKIWPSQKRKSEKKETEQDVLKKINKVYEQLQKASPEEKKNLKKEQSVLLERLEILGNVGRSIGRRKR